MKLNVRFQKVICTEEIKLYPIQNGQFVNIVDFNMLIFWKTAE